MKLFDIVVKAGFAKSKNEARRSILNKGIKLNDFTVIDSNADVFIHENLWLIVEQKRLTTVDTKTGTVMSKDITEEQHREINL